MRTISVRLDDATDALLAAVCERDGLTQTGAVKAAIELLASSKRRTPGELAAELGLIGSFRGPADLATNHAQHVKERLRAKLDRDAMSVPASAGKRRATA